MPLPPENISVSAVNSSFLLVSWSPPAFGQFEGVEAAVYHGPNATDAVATQSAGSDENDMLIPDLQPGSDFLVMVKSYVRQMVPEGGARFSAESQSSVRTRE